jgi:hypothetical protein
MKTIVLILIGMACFSMRSGSAVRQGSVDYARRLIVGTKPVARDRGYVPDQATAIRISIAVLIPIYGKKIEDGEKLSVPEKKELYKTSVLPVEPSLSNFEAWPHPIVQLVLSNFRFAENGSQ